MLLVYLFLGISIACVAAMLIGLAAGKPVFAGVTKMIASTAFIALALAAGGMNSFYGCCILVALFFSWWGDLLLIFTDKTLFLLGLIAFFIGHVAFAFAFACGHGIDPIWTGAAFVLLLVPAAIILPWLNKGLGSMRMPVYAYMIVISIMVALAAGTLGNAGTPLILIGGALFYVSDIFVARERFKKSDAWNRYVGLPLYYVAQLILAYTVLLVPA